MPDSKSDLLARYVSGRIDDVERRRLFAAALEDQELFDALTMEDALNDALNDPEGRRKLLVSLEATPRRSRTFMAWSRPLALAASLVGLALTATLLLRQTAGPSAPDLLSLAAAPTEEAASLWSEIDTTPASKSLDGPAPGLDLGRAGDPPRFRAGEVMSVVLSVGGDADLVLLVLPPSGAPRSVPLGDSVRALRLEGGERYTLTGPGGTLVAPSAAGVYKLRLVAVAPEGAEPASAVDVVRGVADGLAAVAEVVFQVTAR